MYKIAGNVGRHLSKTVNLLGTERQNTISGASEARWVLCISFMLANYLPLEDRLLDLPLK